MKKQNKYYRYARLSLMRAFRNKVLRKTLATWCAFATLVTTCSPAWAAVATGDYLGGAANLNRASSGISNYGDQTATHAGFTAGGIGNAGVLDWNKLNVPGGTTLEFNNGTFYNVVNSMGGMTTIAGMIDGSVNANVSIFNPNGIVMQNGSVVNVSGIFGAYGFGIVGSDLDNWINNGTMPSMANVAMSGDVTVNGGAKLTAAQIALAGANISVENGAKFTGPTTLAAGDLVTIDNIAGGSVSFEIPAPSTEGDIDLMGAFTAELQAKAAGDLNIANGELKVDGSLTIVTAGDPDMHLGDVNVNNANVTVAGDITANAAGEVHVLGASNVKGANVTLAAGEGNVEVLGAMDGAAQSVVEATAADGAVTLNAANGNVLLGNEANDMQAKAVGANLNITAQEATLVDQVQNGGVITADKVTLQGSMTQASVAKMATADLVVDNAAQDGDFKLQGTENEIALVSGQAKNLELVAKGDVGQNAALSIAEKTSVTATGDVTFDNVDNDFVGLVNANTKDISLKDKNDLYLGTVAADGSLTADATGNLGVKKGSSVVAKDDIALTAGKNVNLNGNGGSATIKSTEGSISVTADEFVDIVEGATVDAKQDLTVLAKGENTGSGIRIYDAEAKAGENLQLTASEGDIELEESSKVTAGGTLGMTAAEGVITEDSTATIVAEGDATFTATDIAIGQKLARASGASYIVKQVPFANQFGGKVNATATDGDVVIDAESDIDVGTVSASGDVSINAGKTLFIGDTGTEKVTGENILLYAGSKNVEGEGSIVIDQGATVTADKTLTATANEGINVYNGATVEAKATGITDEEKGDAAYGDDAENELGLSANNGAVEIDNATVKSAGDVGIATYAETVMVSGGAKVTAEGGVSVDSQKQGVTVKGSGTEVNGKAKTSIYAYDDGAIAITDDAVVSSGDSTGVSTENGDLEISDGAVVKADVMVGVDSYKGDITIDNATVKGGDFDVNETTGEITASRKTGSAHIIGLQGDVEIKNGAKVAANGYVQAGTAYGALTINNATLASGGEELEGEAGNLTVMGGDSVTIENGARLLGKGDVIVGKYQYTPYYAFTSDSVTIDDATVEAEGGVLVMANDATTLDGTAKVGANKNIHVEGGSVTVGKDAIVIAAKNATVEATGTTDGSDATVNGTVRADGGTAYVHSEKNINVGEDALVTAKGKNGNVGIDAVGDVTVSGTLKAEGSGVAGDSGTVLIGAGGNINLDDPTIVGESKAVYMYGDNKTLTVKGNQEITIASSKDIAIDHSVVNAGDTLTFIKGNAADDAKLVLVTEWLGTLEYEIKDAGAQGKGLEAKNATVTSAGNVAQAADSAVIVATESTFTAADGNVTLDSVNNDFGGPVNVTAKNAKLVDKNAIELGDVTVDETLKANAVNILIDDGAVVTAKGTSLAIGDEAITLDASENVLIENGTVTAENGKLVAKAGQTVDVRGDVGDTSVTASKGDVSLEGGVAVSVANGANVEATEGNVTLLAKSASSGAAGGVTVNSGHVTAAQKITASAEKGDITLAGALGAGTLEATDVELTAADGDIVMKDAATVTVNGTFTATAANGDFEEADTAAILAKGTATFTAMDVDAKSMLNDFAKDGDANLAKVNATATAGDIVIGEKNTVRLGVVEATGDVTVNAGEDIRMSDSETTLTAENANLNADTIQIEKDAKVTVDSQLSAKAVDDVLVFDGAQVKAETVKLQAENGGVEINGDNAAAGETLVQATGDVEIKAGEGVDIAKGAMVDAAKDLAITADREGTLESGVTIRDADTLVKAGDNATITAKKGDVTVKDSATVAAAQTTAGSSLTLTAKKADVVIDNATVKAGDFSVNTTDPLPVVEVDTIGNLVIDAKVNATIKNGAEVGASGTANVEADKVVTVTGTDTKLVANDTLTIEASGAGKAGAAEISDGATVASMSTVDLDADTELKVDNATVAAHGDLTADAGTILIQNSAKVGTDANATITSKKSGGITVQSAANVLAANDLTLTADKNGGDITIQGADTLVKAGKFSVSDKTVTSTTQGKLTIDTANHVTIQDGATVAANGKDGDDVAVVIEAGKSIEINGADTKVVADKAMTIDTHGDLTIQSGAYVGGNDKVTIGATKSPYALTVTGDGTMLVAAKDLDVTANSISIADKAKVASDTDATLNTIGGTLELKGGANVLARNDVTLNAGAETLVEAATIAAGNNVDINGTGKITVDSADAKFTAGEFVTIDGLDEVEIKSIGGIAAKNARIANEDATDAKDVTIGGDVTADGNITVIAKNTVNQNANLTAKNGSAYVEAKDGDILMKAGVTTHVAGDLQPDVNGNILYKTTSGDIKGVGGNVRLESEQGMVKLETANGVIGENIQVSAPVFLAETTDAGSTVYGNLEGDVKVAYKTPGSVNITHKDGTLTIADASTLGSLYVNKVLQTPDVEQVLLQDAASATKGITAGENLTIAGVNDRIEQESTALVDVGGVTTLSATKGDDRDGDIILGNSGNDFRGKVHATGENITLSDVNELNLGDVAANKDLTASANDVLIDKGAVVSAGGSADFTATRNVIVTKATVTAVGDLKAVAGNDVAINGELGDTTVESTTGSVTLEGNGGVQVLENALVQANAEGEKVVLHSKDGATGVAGVKVDGATVKAEGGTVEMTADKKSVLVTGVEEAPGLVTAKKVAITATDGNIRFEGEAKTVATDTGAGAFAATASRNITEDDTAAIEVAGEANFTAKDIDAKSMLNDFAKDGDADLAKVNATATDGDIVLGEKNTVRLGVVEASGDVTVNAGEDIRMSDSSSSLTAENAMLYAGVTAADGAKTGWADNGTIQIEKGAKVTLGSRLLASACDDILILDGAQVQAAGKGYAISLDTYTGGVEINGDNAAAGATLVKATATDGGNVLIRTGEGVDIAKGALVEATKDVTIIADNIGTLEAGVTVRDADTLVKAGGNARIGAETGNVTVKDKAAVVADNADSWVVLNAERADVLVTGQATVDGDIVGLGAGTEDDAVAGNVTVSDKAEVRGESYTLLQAKDDVTINDAKVKAGVFDETEPYASTKDGMLQIVAGKAVTIENSAKVGANNGVDVDAYGSATVQGSDTKLVSGTTLTVDAPVLTVQDGANIAAMDKVTLTAPTLTLDTGANVESKKDVNLVSTGTATLQGGARVGSDANVDIDANVLNVYGTTVIAADSVDVDATGKITVDSADANFKAGEFVTIDGLDEVEIKSIGGIAAKNARIANEDAAEAKDVTIGGNVTADGNITVIAKGTVNQNANLSAGNDVATSGGGSVYVEAKEGAIILANGVVSSAAGSKDSSVNGNILYKTTNGEIKGTGTEEAEFATLKSENGLVKLESETGAIGKSIKVEAPGFLAETTGEGSTVYGTLVGDVKVAYKTPGNVEITHKDGTLTIANVGKLGDLNINKVEQTPEVVEIELQREATASKGIKAAGDVKITGENDYITQESDAVVEAGGVTTISATKGAKGNGDINLYAQNDFQGKVHATGENITLNDVNELNLGDVAANKDLTASANDILIDKDATVSADFKATLQAERDIYVTKATVTAKADITATAGRAIVVHGDQGATTVKSTEGSVTFAAGSEIDVMNGATVEASVGNVTLHSQKTDPVGIIVDGGHVIAGETATLDADVGDVKIAGAQEAGTIAARNVSINADKGDIVMEDAATVSASDTLNATAEQGYITEADTAAFLISGEASFKAQDIYAPSALNDFQAKVNAEATEQDLVIRDANDISLGKVRAENGTATIYSKAGTVKADTAFGATADVLAKNVVLNGESKDVEVSGGGKVVGTETVLLTAKQNVNVLDNGLVQSTGEGSTVTLTAKKADVTIDNATVMAGDFTVDTTDPLPVVDVDTIGNLVIDAKVNATIKNGAEVGASGTANVEADKVVTVTGTDTKLVANDTLTIEASGAGKAGAAEISDGATVAGMSKVDLDADTELKVDNATVAAHGDLTADAGSVLIQNSAKVGTDANATITSKKSGGLTVQSGANVLAANDLTLTSEKNGGDITIQGADTLVKAGKFSVSDKTVTSTSNGKLTIDSANHVYVKDQATVAANGKDGDDVAVAIDAGKSIEINDAGTKVLADKAMTIDTHGDLTIQSGAYVGGNDKVTIGATKSPYDLLVTGDGTSLVAAKDLDVTANSITIADQAKVASDTDATLNTIGGTLAINGGANVLARNNVTLNAGAETLVEAATIAAGNNVDVNGTGKITVDSADAKFTAGEFVTIDGLDAVEIKSIGGIAAKNARIANEDATEAKDVTIGGNVTADGNITVIAKGTVNQNANLSAGNDVATSGGGSVYVEAKEGAIILAKGVESSAAGSKDSTVNGNILYKTTSGEIRGTGTEESDFATLKSENGLVKLESETGAIGKSIKVEAPGFLGETTGEGSTVYGTLVGDVKVAYKTPGNVEITHKDGTLTIANVGKLGDLNINKVEQDPKVVEIELQRETTASKGIKADGDVTITGENDYITQDSDAIFEVGGSTTFSVTKGSKVIEVEGENVNGDISLTSANDFHGDDGKLYITTAENVTVNDAGTLSLGNSTINETLTASADNIVEDDTEAVVVKGDANFKAKDINVASALNDFQGKVNAEATENDITIRDANDISLGKIRAENGTATIYANTGLVKADTVNGVSADVLAKNVVLNGEADGDGNGVLVTDNALIQGTESVLLTAAEDVTINGNASVKTTGAADIKIETGDQISIGGNSDIDSAHNLLAKAGGDIEIVDETTIYAAENIRFANADDKEEDGIAGNDITIANDLETGVRAGKNITFVAGDSILQNADVYAECGSVWVHSVLGHIEMDANVKAQSAGGPAEPGATPSGNTGNILYKAGTYIQGNGDTEATMSMLQAKDGGYISIEVGNKALSVDEAYVKGVKIDGNSVYMETKGDVTATLVGNTTTAYHTEDGSVTLTHIGVNTDNPGEDEYGTLKIVKGSTGNTGIYVNEVKADGTIPTNEPDDPKYEMKSTTESDGIVAGKNVTITGKKHSNIEIDSLVQAGGYDAEGTTDPYAGNIVISTDGDITIKNDYDPSAAEQTGLSPTDYSLRADYGTIELTAGRKDDGSAADGKVTFEYEKADLVLDQNMTINAKEVSVDAKEGDLVISAIDTTEAGREDATAHSTTTFNAKDVVLVAEEGDVIIKDDADLTLNAKHVEYDDGASLTINAKKGDIDITTTGTIQASDSDTGDQVRDLPDSEDTSLVSQHAKLKIQADEGAISFGTSAKETGTTAEKMGTVKADGHIIVDADKDIYVNAEEFTAGRNIHISNQVADGTDPLAAGEGNDILIESKLLAGNSSPLSPDADPTEDPVSKIDGNMTIKASKNVLINGDLETQGGTIYMQAAREGDQNVGSIYLGAVESGETANQIVSRGVDGNIYMIAEADDANIIGAKIDSKDWSAVEVPDGMTPVSLQAWGESQEVGDDLVGNYNGWVNMQTTGSAGSDMDIIGAHAGVKSKGSVKMKIKGDVVLSIQAAGDIQVTHKGDTGSITVPDGESSYGTGNANEVLSDFRDNIEDSEGAVVRTALDGELAPGGHEMKDTGKGWSAGGDIIVTAPGDVDFHVDGQMEAGNDIKLNVGGDLDVKQDGYIEAGRDVDMTIAGDQVINGDFTAGRDITQKIGGDQVVSGSIDAGRNLTEIVGGDISTPGSGTIGFGDTLTIRTGSTTAPIKIIPGRLIDVMSGDDEVAFETRGGNTHPEVIDNERHNYVLIDSRVSGGNSERRAELLAYEDYAASGIIRLTPVFTYMSNIFPLSEFTDLQDQAADLTQGNMTSDKGEVEEEETK